MSTTLLDSISTPLGDFTVMTKEKRLLSFGKAPHTSVMPNNPILLGKYGVQVQWEVSNEAELSSLHKAVLNIVKGEDGVGFLLALREHTAQLIQLPNFEFNALTRSGLLADMLDQLPSTLQSAAKLIAAHIRGVR